MKFLDKLESYSPMLVRFSICFVFLWFGINEIFLPKSFSAYLPQWLTSSLPVDALTFVKLNGIAETILGSLLVLGLFTRLISLLLVLHFISIIAALGYSDIAIRDIGLALVTLSIFLHGPDSWSFDRRMKSE